MGFLKELFEKKLKTAGREYDENGLMVGRSAQSDWSLPALRPGQLQAEAPEDSTSPGSISEASNKGDSIVFLQTQQSAKSFSSALTTRKQQIVQAETLQAAQWQLAERVKYDNINQFSQKVELYRGSVATVFKAVCTATNLKVIIKAYYKQKMHPKHIHKLHREIAAMRTLNGPYVAEFYCTFEDVQCMYIVMEYCEGGDLFKTMLMHGGLLDEQWVCVEVITPLLRILEKMHSLKLLHRDIKPENIFLTALGKFRLGDFGLAIKYDEELPFSRSGTLDYMAPEVLKNPSVAFQEGRSVELATLTSKGVKPYGPPVDVWAAGVLAYELVCGRPPFEVEDEAQTAALIMYSDTIKFPPNRTPQWCEFVKAALTKNPEARPTATSLLKHTWIVTNIQRTLSEQHRPSKELLLQPLPLDIATALAGTNKEFKRTQSSLTASDSSSRAASGGQKDIEGTLTASSASLSPLPAGGLPTGNHPALPAAFPGTPSGAARQLQQLSVADLDFGPSSSGVSVSGSSSGSTGSTGCALRPSNVSVGTSGSNSATTSSGGNTLAALVSPAATAERLRDSEAGQAKRANIFKESGPSSLLVSPRGASFTAADRLHHPSPLGSPSGANQSHPAVNGLHSPTRPAGSHRSSATGSLGSAVGSAGPAAKHGVGLKVVLPPEAELEVSISSDSFLYSPGTPLVKPGIKERMKHYFQRQAGGSGNGF